MKPSAELEKKGYRLSSGPTKSAVTGSILAFLDAPEGYGVELIEEARA
jgi:lactoylglutathione lyase